MTSDKDNEPSVVSAIVDSVMENLKHIPASTQSHYMAGDSSSRTSNIFGHRQKRLHDLLGGGHSADVLLWKKKHLSAGFLAAATVIWFLFEWSCYHFVSVVSFLLLVIVVTLFVWSNAAAFLNRAPPPVPKLQLSNDQVRYVAENITVYVNRLLAMLYEIVIGKDATKFLKLVGVLGFLVIFGSWFNFLTLMYLGVVAAHTLPLLYEKHGETIDQLADSTFKELKSQYRKFDASVLSRIPRKQPTFQRKAD
ncbi:hypothetical protein GOP47_0017398 [Adiantum capillus-veneris]|uniref:Reticulon-like protein n=1 Tax=Adiantum capillus-veneris TaxID=13818 RepID=A0A9D4UFI8_ADICA|nr:hypothetical protein GOP47_0017398 [Adiantum capillus-veneris]